MVSRAGKDGFSKIWEKPDWPKHD